VNTGEPIDAVYTWVDGQSPEFQRSVSEALDEYSETADTNVVGAGRFRDNSKLRRDGTPLKISYTRRKRWCAAESRPHERICV